MPHEYRPGETVDGTYEGPIIHGVSSGISGTVRTLAISPDGNLFGGATTESNVTWSSATTIDMGASWNSDTIDVSTIKNFSIDGQWEGAATPVGTLVLQASNGGTWNDITNSDLSVNGASNAVWNLTDQQYKQLRISYTRTSGGAGDDFSAIFYAKGF